MWPTDINFVGIQHDIASIPGAIASQPNSSSMRAPERPMQPISHQQYWNNLDCATTWFSFESQHLFPSFDSSSYSTDLLVSAILSNSVSAPYHAATTTSTHPHLSHYYPQHGLNTGPMPRSDPVGPVASHHPPIITSQTPPNYRILDGHHHLERYPGFK